MSNIYNRQVAQTRNAQPAETKTLQLHSSELELLQEVLQREELIELNLVQSSKGDNPPFRLLKIRALLQKCKDL